MQKIFLFTFTVIVFNSLLINAQVSINTDGTSPPSSAMFEVRSTDKGMLVPRMSASERDNITNPVVGLMVYVTDDSSFYYHSGNEWLKIQPGADWIVSGNDIYSAVSGNVGVGTISPNAKLDIQTSSFSSQLANVNYAVFGQYLANSNYGFLGGPFRGVYGTSASNYGVHGNTATGYALYGNATSTGYAGYFDGEGYFSDNLVVDGNLGIGISSPASALHVNGTVTATAFSGNGAGLTNTGDNLGNHTASANIVLGSHYLSGDGGNEGVYILSNGKVGIGTSVINDNLHVRYNGDVFLGLERTTSSLVGINFRRTGDSEPQWIFPFIRGWQSSNLIFREEANNIDAVKIEYGTGYVGIGNLNYDPAVRLHLFQGAPATLSGGGFFQIGESTGINLVMDDHEIMARNNSAGSELNFNRDGGNVILNLNSGNVGIGTGSPSEKLHVDGGAFIEGKLTFEVDTMILAISPCQFTPESDLSSFSNEGTRLSTGITVGTTHFWAPLIVPDGVKILSVISYWQDETINSPDGTIKLIKKDNSSGGTAITNSWSVDSGSAMGAYHSRTFLPNTIVDNDNYFYYMKLSLEASPLQDLYFHGVKIKYTYTRPN